MASGSFMYSHQLQNKHCFLYQKILRWFLLSQRDKWGWFSVSHCMDDFYSLLIGTLVCLFYFILICKVKRWIWSCLFMYLMCISLLIFKGFEFFSNYVFVSAYSHKSVVPTMAKRSIWSPQVGITYGCIWVLWSELRDLYKHNKCLQTPIHITIPLFLLLTLVWVIHCVGHKGLLSIPCHWHLSALGISPPGDLQIPKSWQ